MSKADILLFQGRSASRKHQVASGSAASITAGEPVGKTLGNQYVALKATSTPIVGTDYVAGIAASTSTDTAAADGTVEIYDLVPGQVWLISPKTAATWNTQTKYNALAGARVTWDLTSSAFTLNAVDGATNGCVVENINIAETPGKVAFSIRAGASYLA